jgi:hypothetical protein
MKLWMRRIAPGVALAAFATLALSQSEPRKEPPRLPNGKSQSEELLKAEHEQNLKDVSQLVEMAEQLKDDLEKNDRHVLSIATLKKTDEIEKLVKRIRSRLRRN